MIPFHKFRFAPVIMLPDNYVVLDLSQANRSQNIPSPLFSIGKYNETRAGMYTEDLFSGDRNIHMGIDIGAPVGTNVYSFYAGEIFLFGYNSEPGDYGYTLITKHEIAGVDLYALFGHLSAESIHEKKIGQPIQMGEKIGTIGNSKENGSWPPHLHFQLSYVRPEKCDFPGVVNVEEREKSLAQFPDPRLVLGNLY